MCNARFCVLLVNTDHHVWHLKAQREVHRHQQNQHCTYHCRHRRRALSLLLLRPCLQGWSDKECGRKNSPLKVRHVCRDGRTKSVWAIYSPMMVQHAKFNVHQNLTCELFFGASRSVLDPSCHALVSRARICTKEAEPCSVNINFFSACNVLFGPRRYSSTFSCLRPDPPLRPARGILREPRMRSPSPRHPYRCRRQASADSSHCGRDRDCHQMLFVPCTVNYGSPETSQTHERT